MIELYIDHFKTGSIETHMDSQRKWIRDKSPAVETCLGWIEKYIDPERCRAYFEGFVAIVDKEESKLFQQLVSNSEIIVPQFPVPPEMQKEFLAPDFTQLDVITFASKGCPLAINIPNYAEIRNHEGFKNVYLANSAMSAKE